MTNSISNFNERNSNMCPRLEFELMIYAWVTSCSVMLILTELLHHCSVNMSSSTLFDIKHVNATHRVVIQTLPQLRFLCILCLSACTMYSLQTLDVISVRLPMMEAHQEPTPYWKFTVMSSAVSVFIISYDIYIIYHQNKHLVVVFVEEGAWCHRYELCYVVRWPVRCCLPW